MELEFEVELVLAAMAVQTLIYALRVLASLAEVRLIAEGWLGPRELPLPPLFGRS